MTEFTVTGLPVLLTTRAAPLSNTQPDDGEQPS